jgi:ZIP family zinc transporter
MLASTMMPEAYEEGGNIVGLVTVAGFLFSFILSHLE